MNNELNDILNGRPANKSPFKVPENYFDTLNERIMAAIPDERNEVAEKSNNIMFFSIKQLRWAAAIACMIIAGVTATLYSLNDNNNKELNAEFQGQYVSPSDDALMEAADYAMMDNQDMYQLLAEE